MNRNTNLDFEDNLIKQSQTLQHNQNENQDTKVNPQLKTGKIRSSKDISLNQSMNQSIDMLQPSTQTWCENPSDMSMSTNLIRSTHEPKQMDFIGNMKKYLTNTTNLIQNYSKPPKVTTFISKLRTKSKTPHDNKTSEKKIKDEFKDINEQYKSLCKMDKRNEQLKKDKSYRRKLRSAIDCQSDISVRSRSINNSIHQDEKHSSLERSTSYMSDLNSNRKSNRKKLQTNNSGTDLSYNNDSLCSLSNFEQNQQSNISTIKSDASNKKIVLNEDNSPLNYSCNKYSQQNSEYKLDTHDDDELFLIKNITLTTDELDDNMININKNGDQYEIIQKDNEDKENLIENNQDIVSKVTNKVFLNNSFEIDQNQNQNIPEDKQHSNAGIENKCENESYSNKDNFNKLISDMRSKAYKPQSFDNADNESTKLIDQTSNYLNSDINPIDKSMNIETEIDINSKKMKKLRSKYQNTFKNHACMPNILMSVIHDIKDKPRDHDRLLKEKRIKIAETKENKFNKILKKAVGTNPQADMFQQVNAMRKKNNRKNSSSVNNRSCSSNRLNV